MRTRALPRIHTAAAAILALGLATACSSDVPSAPETDRFVELQGPNANENPITGSFVFLCKIAGAAANGLPDDGTLGQPFDFSVEATGGIVREPNPTITATTLAITVGQDCSLVWENPTEPFDDQTLVSITELAKPGFEIESAFYEYFFDGVFLSYDLQGGSTVALPPRDGLVVYFKNVAVDEPPPPPPGGGDGCTPGYWRQPHHYDDWVGYSPDDIYSDVFGVGPDISLGKAVKLGGGGFRALTRHSVAALLNASNGDVSFDLTEAEVISAVQEAYATGDPETTKNLFEGFNEQGCPLGEGDD